MSESKTASTDVPTTVPSFSDEEVFLRVWSQFYSRAVTAIDAPPPSSNQAIGVLNATTKILFGLDTKKKSLAVSYGMGVLELSLALHKTACDSSNKDQTTKKSQAGEASSRFELDLTTLKCIKCIVVRNPAGRSRCRLAGVFDWLDNILSCLLENVGKRGKDDSVPEAVVLEEALTTLAAMCLGDDLNALQGAVNFRQYVDKASELFSPEKYGTMNQKILYLRALFDTMCKDEDDLVQVIKNEKYEKSQSFFELVVTAEAAVCEAEKISQGKNYEKESVVAKYNETETVFQTIEKSNFPIKTRLLDPLRCKMHRGRATARLCKDKGEVPNEADANAALCDADAVLKHGSGILDGDELTAANRLRADALNILGRKEEAKEAMSTSPGNEDLTSKFANLSS